MAPDSDGGTGGNKPPESQTNPEKAESDTTAPDNQRRASRRRDIPRTLMDQALPELPEGDRLGARPEEPSPPVPQRLPGGGYPIPHIGGGGLTGEPQQAPAVVEGPAPQTVPSEAAIPPVHSAPAAPESSYSLPPTAAASNAVPMPVTSNLNAGVKKPKRQGVARTVMDIFVNIGNQLTGSQNQPDPNYLHQTNSDSITNAADNVTNSGIYGDSDSHGAPDGYGTHDYYGEQTAQESPANFDPQYSADDSQSYAESHEARVSKTLLDHSVLFEMAEKTEARRATKAVEEAREKANQPVKPFLAVIHKKNATPCGWRWDEESKDHIRYCGLCKNPVYNFTGLEMPEAEALIFKHENLSDPTIFKRNDGKYMTSDCPLEAKKKFTLMMAVFGGVLVLIAVVGLMTMMPPPKPKAAETLDGSKQSTGLSADPSSDHSAAHRSSAARHASTVPDFSGKSSAIEQGQSSSGGTGAVKGATNGGYGPSSAPSADDNFQWQFSGGANSGSQPPNSSVVSGSNPASSPKPAQESQSAELARLKKQLIDQESGPASP